MKNNFYIKSMSFYLSFLLLIMLSNKINAQETNFRESSWRYGLNLGLQYNAACLGWQQLHGTDFNFHSPENNIDIVDGTGLGIYGGLFGEYLSNSWWGLQFRISYDVRNALAIDDTRLPIPSFDINMAYLTFEPLFRIDQSLIPNLNFYIGPYLAANLQGSYIYKYDESKPVSEPAIDIANLNSITYGLETGFAYDIKLKDIDSKTSLYLSPFMDFSWMVNQKETIKEPTQNSFDDVWSTVAYRVGLRLSIDNHKEPSRYIATDQGKLFVVMPTDNTILTKNIKGYFPIHPYVFFDKGSQEIPSRYILLSKAEATNFKEGDLENFIKGDLTVKETNVNQLMTTYYNVLNVFGDRMRNNPGEDLTLIGSDPEEIDGEPCANKVKSYLVNNFGIDPDRIKILVGTPAKPSGSLLTNPVYKGYIDEENRRVVFVFSNPEMLKPIPYTIRDESSIDNDMVFSVGNSVPFKSWDITITGEGRTMYFGPFIYSSERINPAELMRFLQSGKYNAKVVITEQSGKQTEENISFKLIKDSEIKNASRYLMLFDYNKSDAISSYETKIRKEITPGIELGDKVIVHGHTDIIGSEVENQKLSQERANQAKRILDEELAKEKKPIKVQALGIGQTKMQYTFNNRYPEGRMYNRNIFVEVIK